MDNRKIDKSLAKYKEPNKEAPLEYDEDDEITQDFLEEEITEKKEIKDKTYADIITQMPELKQDLDYILIQNKLKESKQLTNKEIDFKIVYEEAKQKEIEFEETTKQKMQFEIDQQKEIQEKIDKEYNEFKEKQPDKVEVIDTKNIISLNNSSNFLQIALNWTKLIKAKKKGGKIFVKVLRGKKVSFEYTNKDIHFVEFWSTNTRGDRIKEITRVSQHNYSFNGTSVPVIFAIQGFFESWDFYSEFKKDLSAEYVSGVVMEAYNLGFKDGLILNDKEKNKGGLESILPYLPIIITVMCIAMIYFLYMMYQDQTKMLEAIQQLQAVANAGVMVVG